jgi:hypothetical protein
LRIRTYSEYMRTLHEEPSFPAASSSRPLDRTLGWPVRHPWLVAIGASLVPVVLTAGGFAVAQVRGLDDLGTYLTVASAVTVSALVGFLIMWLWPRLSRAEVSA